VGVRRGGRGSGRWGGRHGRNGAQVESSHGEGEGVYQLLKSVLFYYMERKKGKSTWLGSFVM